MRASVIKIIENIGFKKSDDEYVADFYDEKSDEIIEFVVKESEDKNGLPLTKFYAFDERNQFISELSLDQMLDEVDTYLKLVPRQSNKTYRVSARIDVLVNMEKVPNRVYKECIKEKGFALETAIVEYVVEGELKEYLKECILEVIKFNLEYTEELE